MNKKRNKKWYENHKENKDGIIERQCTQCKKWLKENTDNFYLHNKKKPELGFSSECKSCATKRTQTNYYKNPEKRIEYFEKYRKEENREQYLETQKKYNHENLENRYESTKEWQKNNPERIRYHNFLHRNHDVSTKEYQSMLKVFDYQCAYCGMTYEEHKKKYHEKLHNDHVDEDGYNDLRNDVPACKRCNTSKHEYDMEEWFKKQESFSEDRLERIKWWIKEGYKNHIEDKSPYRYSRSRIYNKDGTWRYQHELWTVDEKRNMIKCVDIKNKKKDLDLSLINTNQVIGL